MSHRYRIIFCLIALASWPACDTRDAHRSSPVPARDTVSDGTTGRCDHGLYSTLCTKCNPAIAAVFQAKGDWCAEHGFPESFCPICNPGAPLPDLRGTSPPVHDWCVGHAVPESKCTKCNPSLIPRFKETGDWCEGHGYPESVCPLCNPQQPPPGIEKADIETRIVRLRPPDMESLVGIRTETARRIEISNDIECTARIAFDSDRVADVRAVVPGVIRRVNVELGAYVEKGTRLFELESTRVGEVQGELQAAKVRARTAFVNLERKRELEASTVASAREVEVAAQELAAAQTEVRAAEATLRIAGAARSKPSGRYALVAPIAGSIIRRPAVVGLLANQSESLATVADTTVMWALCDVPEVDASALALEQRMIVTIDNDDGSIEGTITWIAAEVDRRTRTVTARAAVANSDGRLRANQFARARIRTGNANAGVTVPRAAVQRVGEREVVFVRTAKGVYAPRVVDRHGDGDSVSVEGRVQDGVDVVTIGAALLRTEIMPGSIGAGCCEVDRPGAN